MKTDWDSCESMPDSAFDLVEDAMESHEFYCSEMDVELLDTLWTVTSLNQGLYFED